MDKLNSQLKDGNANSENVLQQVLSTPQTWFTVMTIQSNSFLSIMTKKHLPPFN
jgi:hypothetical protein